MKTWTKTVAGLLKTRDQAQFAINDLINCGIPQDAITLRFQDVEHHVWSEEEETDLEKGIGNEGQDTRQEMGALGNIGSNEARVRVGRGDIAVLTELGIPESDARYYSDGINRGGFLLTVVVNNDRAEESAEILRRHGADEDEFAESQQGQGWKAEPDQYFGDASLEEPVRARLSPENVPLSHATLSEQLERAEVFRDKGEEASGLAAKGEGRFVGKEVSLPSFDIFQQRDIKQFEVQQRESQEGNVSEGHVQQREFQRPEAGVGAETAGVNLQSGGQQVNVSGMNDDEFQRHFRATYGERGERFEEPYRSAYYFAQAESTSHPQFMDKEWFEVEEEIHRDWEISHPGTWSRVESAIHFGWDKTRRSH
jgi:hypothetical protein